ncbi:hypothetical protein L6452_42160 [Arctium lappa]|uniref:Uncharacterized protein n=1 Tax=Arctium lappa TaxID=4217 RepID=A0ACB8XIP1_ARCLA|nr:hypothetical protein L6452_42160 [Arctium lappa]
MSDTSNQQPPKMSDTSSQQPLEMSDTRDWEEAKNIIDSNRESRDLLGYSISQDKETPLHTAIRSQNIKIVEHVVDRMTEHQLVLQDKYGYTALFDVAAVGNVDMGRAMVENDCPKSYVDCALKILDDNNQIGFPQQKYALEVLYTLARKTYAFNDMKSWKTKMGNSKFLVELIHGYPDISFMANDDDQSIFHIAVSHRHESIYNLLYEMGSMHDIVNVFKDKHDNNMLHLVGMKAKNPLEDVSGAPFQMQRELLWFEIHLSSKEVNSKVPPYCREEKNDAGCTPLQLFIKNHQDLVSEGEKWMKETANQCMVVSALITTIVFSVAFTIPGGYDQNNGLPIFLKDGPFIAFVILDAISLILSSASILMFLSILTSRYTYHDFRISLPTKLMIGLTTLFLSIISMMVAFSISFFVLYRNKLILLPIIISVGVVVPIFLNIRLQFPLLVDVYRSTYGSMYLFRPKKHVLFYRNPRF